MNESRLKKILASITNQYTYDKFYVLLLLYVTSIGFTWGTIGYAYESKRWAILTIVALIILHKKLHLLVIILNVLILLFYYFDKNLLEIFYVSVLLAVNVITIVFPHKFIFFNPFLYNYSKRIGPALNVFSITIIVLAFLITRFSVLLGFLWGVFFFLLSSGLRKYVPLQRVRISHVFLNTVIVIVSIVLSLVFLELGSQLLLSDLRTKSHDLHINHKEAFYTLRPDYQGEIFVPLNDPKTKEAFKVSISNQGLRGEEILRKEQNEFRIVLAGDSFTFGWGVNDEHTLDRYLNEYIKNAYPDKKIQVINAGVGGYGPWQSYLFILERVLIYEPDIILFQTLVANDIADSLLKVWRFPRVFDRASSLDKASFKVRNQWQYRLEKWLSDNSVAYSHLAKIIANDRPLISILSPTVFAPREHAHTVPHPDEGFAVLEIDRKEWYETLEEGWHLFLEDLIAIRELCVVNNIDVFFYNIPYPTQSRHFIYPELFEGDYEMDKAENLLYAFFDKQNWPHIFVRDCLRSYDGDEDIVFPADGHLTPWGNYLLAGCLFDYLVKNGHI